MTGRAAEGRWGEDYAADYLSREGYEIVARNWHCRYGEIDVIAKKGEILAFVEVKTRKTGSLTTPEEAISPSKIRKLRLSVECYLTEHWDPALQPRFDVAALIVKPGNPYTLEDFRYYESAFEGADN